MNKNVFHGKNSSEYNHKLHKAKHKLLRQSRDRKWFYRDSTIFLRLLGGGGGNFQCWKILLIWIIVRQGPFNLAIGAGGGCLEIFFLSPIISLFFLLLNGDQLDIG